MRYFVITGHKALADASFKLDDLAGGAGRMDILVRCVNSAFVMSHNLRKDAEIYLVLEGGDEAPKTVRINGASVKYLNPDERSTAALIRNALLKKIPEGKEISSSPGVFISKMGFDEVIDKLAPLGNFVYLKEDGTDCREFEFPENPIFVLGDNHDPTPEEEAKLFAQNPSKINVGPYSLHADHCMILVQNELDRRLAAKGDTDAL